MLNHYKCMTKVKIRIGGMTCAACSSSVERALNNVEGVSKAAVNLATNTATVDFDDRTTDVSKLHEAVEDTGFDVIDTDGGKEEKDNERNTQIRLIVAVIFTIPLLYVAMGPMVGAPFPDALHDDHKIYAILQLALCIPVLIAGSNFYVRGFPNLIRLRPNMDTLVALGTSAALIFSVYATVNIFNGSGDAHSLYFESAATIITLVMLGKYLESRSKYRTGESVRKLMRLAPLEANVIRDGFEIAVPVGEVIVGDTVMIRPGERIPVDGIIEEGSTVVDESMLTGESEPADRTAGDHLYGGTMNINGSVRMTAGSVGDDMVLSQIIRMIEDAQSSKAPVARLADKVAGYFVPAVMAIALISCMLWLVSGKDLEFALTVLISVLVIACPCALGLATPLAIIVGTGKAAEHGILFKNAESLEASGHIDAVALDKTGTVTVGRPNVTDVVSLVDTSYLIRVAASAESFSEHPLGKAVTEYGSGYGLTTPTGFKAHIGNGIECTVDGKEVHIGNLAFMERIGIPVSQMIGEYERLTSEGKTVMIVSEDLTVIGAIAVADTIKTTSTEAVASLKEMGIKVIMVTGDGERTATAIAEKVGIEDVVSETLPGDKSYIIKGLQTEHTVAMVGDGINDAPALTQSDVGIAVGSGTDIAMDSADVVLMNSDLRSVPVSIKIGRRTLKNVKQNLFLAFCYNVIGIPIAAGLLYVFGGPLLDPMIAAAAMSLSSVSVVSNALRLRRFDPINEGL